MSNVILSPNMSLPVPIVGQDPGPDWANNINASLGILDQHDHSAGRGVQVTPNGLNINIDLPIHNNNLVSVKTVNFTSQGAPLAGASPNLGAVYVAGNELYYNDEAGNVVQITNSGSVNAGAGSITGLPSGTASASYNSGSATFIWQSATSTPANLDAGSVIIRDVVANSHGITLSAPNSLAADYSVVFPAALPGSTKFLTIDTSGNIGDSYDVDNVTLQVVSSTIQVKDHGISQVKLGAANYQISSSSGTFQTASGSDTAVTNMTVTITTTGRPVILQIVSDGSGSAGFLGSAASSNTPGIVYSIYRGTILSGTVITKAAISTPTTTNGTYEFGIPGSLIMDPVAAGTYTYLFAIANPAASLAFAYYLSLLAYEL